MAGRRAIQRLQFRAKQGALDSLFKGGGQRKGPNNKHPLLKQPSNKASVFGRVPRVDTLK